MFLVVLHNFLPLPWRPLQGIVDCAPQFLISPCTAFARHCGLRSTISYLSSNETFSKHYDLFVYNSSKSFLVVAHNFLTLRKLSLLTRHCWECPAISYLSLNRPREALWADTWPTSGLWKYSSIRVHRIHQVGSEENQSHWRLGLTKWSNGLRR